MPEATDNLYESRPKAKSDQERDGKTDAMANAEGRPQSIEQLLDQWRDAEVPSEVASLGVRVIEHLAPDGFFRHDVDELASNLQVNETDLQSAARSRAGMVGASRYCCAKLSRVLRHPDPASRSDQRPGGR